MACAGLQDLPGIHARISSVLNTELPAFLSRRRSPPIIDTSDGTMLRPENDEALHVVGLRKFQLDLEREHLRLEKVPVL